MTANHRLKGLAFAVAGFSLLSVGDGVVKSMAGEWPGTAIAALRYAFGAAGVGALLWWREGASGFSCPMPCTQFGRALSVSFASVCFFLAVFAMPLAEATTIQFTTPLIVVVLSAIFLREAAAAAVWIAIAVAFAGVLIVLRPNIAAIGWAGLLPLGTALGMAVMILLNARVSGTGSILQMQFLISAMAVPILVAMSIAGHASELPMLAVPVPDWSIVARCAAVGVSATLAHMLLFAATEQASANDIAPANYAQLIVAMGIGAAFYDEIFDTVALGGAALVIAGGLILWRYQHNRAGEAGGVR
jgi:drug/metabolite transporter (DMT)-like permease